MDRQITTSLRGTTYIVILASLKEIREVIGLQND